MATQKQQQTIEQPKPAPQPKKTGAAIFVMPEEYRFGVKGTIKKPEPPNQNQLHNLKKHLHRLRPHHQSQHQNQFRQEKQ